MCVYHMYVCVHMCIHICVYYLYVCVHVGFSCGSAGKESPAMQETWVFYLVGKITWRRERLSTPVFWPRECHGPYSPWGLKESDTTERFSLLFTMCVYINIHTHTYNLKIYIFAGNIFKMHC